MSVTVRPLPLALATCLLTALPLAAAPPPEAVALRNLGYAELENERPAEAEGTFRQLTEVAPEAPLGHANLAIALLRQQKNDEALAAIERALELAPGRADLLAIRAEIHAWSGRAEAALEDFRAAARRDDRDPELVYAVYRHAETLEGEAAQRAKDEAIDRLVELRPENLVVLLRRGALAIERGDRATASQVYLRVRELLWQAPPVAERALQMVFDALESGDVASARVPAARLENVLKITPMYKSSLIELYEGIQGVPVRRFADEPPPRGWGESLELAFAAASLDASANAGRALVALDLDADERPDVARLRATDDGTLLEIRLAGSLGDAGPTLPAAGLDRLAAVDLDNDGFVDLIGHGAGAELRFWRGSEGGRFAEATDELGLGGIRARALAAFDFDSEGDLDLALVDAEGRLELWRNSLEGPLEPVGEQAFPQLLPRAAEELLASDLDRDGDTDLLIVHDEGVTWLDNLRQGRFANRTAPGGLREMPAGLAAASVDLDGDRWPDLLVAGESGVTLASGNGDQFSPAPLRPSEASDGPWRSILPLDLDNDGRLDLALTGPEGTELWQQTANGWRRAPATFDTEPASALAAEDLDGDGDLDLLVGGARGLQHLDNRKGNANHWLRVRLRGLTTGSDKNNVRGQGATLEVRAGDAYQFREGSGGVVHFGLGDIERPDLLRVVWNNGVPQNRLRPDTDALVVEEQVLKGSCPFLYTWNGERFEFVTDLLWGAPLGMPLAPGVWNSFDPEELVRIDGAAIESGRLELRVTEELWEAAYFDRVRLWVVDHPETAEVASSLRIVPGAEPGDPRLEDRVLATTAVRPVHGVLDGRGRDVTSRVARRDDVYADGYPVADYQGLAPRPWTTTFDLGEAPTAPIRLLLDGWIFPADASLNLAIAQRRDLEPVLTRLEMETPAGWVPLVDPMGFPAGKTKTMVVDTPSLPPEVRRLRIVSSRWLHWDRIVWSTRPVDDRAAVRARLLPDRAELRYRGFSALVRQAPNAPHDFDYHRVTTESPWLPMGGRFTRYGDVSELLAEVDDRFVLLAPGDEVALSFDLGDLPPPAPGERRTLFLESHGYDKDADRNTWRPDTVEPLPFTGMTRYPYAEGESYPDTEHHHRYRDEWLTRQLEER